MDGLIPFPDHDKQVLAVMDAGLWKSESRIFVHILGLSPNDGVADELFGHKQKLNPPSGMFQVQYSMPLFNRSRIIQQGETLHLSFAQVWGGMTQNGFAEVVQNHTIKSTGCNLLTLYLPTASNCGATESQFTARWNQRAGTNILDYFEGPGETTYGL